MADVEMWFHGQYQYFEDACEIPDFPEFSGHAPTQNWGAV
jgi:hypothetical protein